MRPAARYRTACAALLLVAAGASGCARPAGAPPPFTAPLVLGGRMVSPEALEHGRLTYTAFCRPCHGDAGDGKGPAAAGLQPPPRDLRLGIYKFAAVAAGQLPNDADLVRTVRQGLHGTAMLSWDVPAAELDGLIQYVKSFAARWRNETSGEAIVPGPDPWLGRQAEAVARGERAYHGLAQCATACHPAYATRPEIYAFTKELTGMLLTDFRPDLYLPVPKDSDYGFKIVPPDFTFNQLRSGTSAEDIYRVVACGVGGTAMPTWKNVLPETDLWALAHYVQSLVALRGTPAAAALEKRLLDQPAWSPPLPPPPDGGTD